MLGNYLITEDTTMKAFKKLMAAALVCVMALTMLTGCALSDNLAEKALVNKMTSVSTAKYDHDKDLDEAAKEAWNKNKDKEIVTTIEYNKVTYNVVIVKAPTSKTSEQSSWGTQAGTINKALVSTSKIIDNTIKVGVKMFEGSKDDYAVVVAQVK